MQLYKYNGRNDNYKKGHKFRVQTRVYLSLGAFLQKGAGGGGTDTAASAAMAAS